MFRGFLKNGTPVVGNYYSTETSKWKRKEYTYKSEEEEKEMRVKFFGEL